MYKSKHNSPEHKLSEKERRKIEERRRKDDFLMSSEPVVIVPSELKIIEVKIHGISSPAASTPPPLQYDLGDPANFKIYRRPGEGAKPIFANVVVNQPPDNRRVSIRNESPTASRSQHITSSRRPSPGSTSLHRGRSNSRRRFVSHSPRRSRSLRSISPHKSIHRRNRSSIEMDDKPSSSHRHRSSDLLKHHERSPKRHGSRDSSARRSPPSRRSTPSRQYSPSRSKYSPSRSRRGSPVSRREYERDRYRSHHDRIRDYRRSPERRVSPRRHHIPSRNELPVVTVPVHPTTSEHSYINVMLILPNRK